jgi:hypothetical protein
VFRLRRAKQAADYPPGTCTRHVYDTVPWVARGWGDAWQWAESAHRAGYAVTTYPLPGAVAVWDPGTSYGVYGHVAVVTGTQGDGVMVLVDAGGPWKCNLQLGGMGRSAPSHFIQAPPSPHRRGPDGGAGAGRGAGPDAIVGMMQSWDSLAYYWNHDAPLQAIRGGVIAGMIAGLF